MGWKDDHPSKENTTLLYRLEKRNLGADTGGKKGDRIKL